MFLGYSRTWQGFRKSYKKWHNPTDEGWTTESIYHHHITILTNTTILQKIRETQKRFPQHWASSNDHHMLLRCWYIPEESGWSLAGHLSGSHQCHQSSSPVRQKVQNESRTFWSMKSIRILGRGHPATRTATSQGLLESRTQMVRKLLPSSSLRPKTHPFHTAPCGKHMLPQVRKATSQINIRAYKHGCLLWVLWMKEGKCFHWV